MIKVGVFWASVISGIDVIFDIEEYSDNYRCEDNLLSYSKQHKDVWGRLSKEQYNGKYVNYKFDTLPRGRVCYDLENRSYEIFFYRGSNEFVNAVARKIKEIFDIIDEEVFIDVIN